MIRVIQRRLIIPRGDTGIFTIPAMTQEEGAIGVFTIFDPITNTRIFQKQVEIEGENFNISFSHADTVNLKAGEYLWDIKFYKNPILADNKVIDGEEINSYYAAFQAPKCEIRETGDDFLMIEGQPAKIEDLNIILAATEAANAAKVAATEKAEEAAAKLEEMMAAMPTKVSELENDSGYLQAESVPAWAKAAEKPTYTAQEVGALPSDTFIPSKVSDLTDDSGHYTKPTNGIPASDLEETYLTSFTETDPTVPNWAKQAQKPSYTAQEVGALPADTVIPTVPTNVSAFTNDAGYLTTHQDISMKANSADLAAVATSGSYNDLENKPFIPSKVSDLTDDSGHYTKPTTGIPASDLADGVLDVWSNLRYSNNSDFITDLDSFVLGGSYDTPTEIKQCRVTYTPKKDLIPKFDYEGYLRSTTPDALDTSNKVATTQFVSNAIFNSMPDVPTAVSELENDVGYITEYTETDPTVPAWAKAATKPSYTAAEVGAPTVQEMNSAISTAIGNVNSFDMAVVQTLPAQDISTHTIYLVPKTGETNDVYDEYVYINNAWEMVGNTQIDLSDYALKSELPTKVSDLNNDSGYLTSYTETDPTVPQWAKANTKPSYTAVEVGALPSDTHIPSTTAELTNDAGFITVEEVPEVPVQGVQVNGTSILDAQGVANIPVAGSNTLGVTRGYNNSGINIDSSGNVSLAVADETKIKAAISTGSAIPPGRQHISAFYGLAKAAGHDEASSTEPLGTYTPEAKGAIQKMLGISDLIATEENNLIASKAYAVGDVFTANGKLYKATAAIAQDAAIIPAVEGEEITGANCVETNVGDGFVKKTDYAGSGEKATAGLVWDHNGAWGIKIVTGAGYEGALTINGASSAIVKGGSNGSLPITPLHQHEAAFYGLAKAAGDSTQSASSNAIGTYTDDAKSAIRTMLGAIGSENYASTSTAGVVKISIADGTIISTDGTLKIGKSSTANIKAGSGTSVFLMPSQTDLISFYGLAKAAGDTTQSASSNAVGNYTESAKSAIKNMLGITQTLTVTVLTQDNVTVTGQTVTVRAVDSTGPIFATAAYEGQPVAFSVPSGFAYHVSVSDTLDHHFNPTTVSGIVTNTDISVTLQYSDFSTIQSARDIKAALNASMDLTDLVGEQITCMRNGETLTWDVVDYDSTNGSIMLLLHDAFGTANMVFEPAQALMWCENGLAAGDYTFTWNTTQCYFTLTTAIPAGGQLRATNSQFQTYASQSATVTLETGTVGTDAIAGATDLGHEGQGLLNHRDRVNYGSNNIAESAIQWWLNSDAAAGTLRTPVTKFSRAYSYNVPGLMNGLDQDFIDCLSDVDWLCSTNNVYECPEELGGYTKGTKQAYTIKSKFCLASEMEIFGSYGGNPDGSTVFDLYNGAEADDRKKYRGTSAQVWWLRSPNWYLAYYERDVGSSGSASHGGATNSCGVVPACRISRDTEVSE